MNYLSEFKELKNQYFGIRHGKSLANENKILASNIKYGMKEYGLSDIGKRQVFENITESDLFNNKTVIYSSRFLRAKETAEIISFYFDIKNVFFSDQLNERFFGRLDLKSENLCHEIRDKDISDPWHKTHGVESVLEITERTTKFIKLLESYNENQIFLLVSHCDPLMILQNAFLKNPSSKYRELGDFKNGEIRKLKLSSKS